MAAGLEALHEQKLVHRDMAVLVNGLDSRRIEFTKGNSEFDPIRNDPRFDKLGASQQ